MISFNYAFFKQQIRYVKIILQLVHISPVNPSWQPRGQVPLILGQGLNPRQWAHVNAQSAPYKPGPQTTYKSLLQECYYVVYFKIPLLKNLISISFFIFYYNINSKLNKKNNFTCVALLSFITFLTAPWASSVDVITRFWLKTITTG